MLDSNAVRFPIYVCLRSVSTFGDKRSMKPQKVKKVYQRISTRAAALLQKDEGIDVDWKRNTEFKAEDLVAFANSAAGGVLLLGVDEIKGSNGRQVPKIVGCDVGDQARLTILNKAGDCAPPIQVQLFIENNSKAPFWRIEIPSGTHKPYCTKQGVYKVRGDGKNSPLLPEELLSLYLQEQGGRFSKNFKNATIELNNIIENLRMQVDRDLGDLHNTVEELRGNLEIMMLDLTSGFERTIEDANGAIAETINDIHADLTQAIEDQTSEAGASILHQVETTASDIKGVESTLTRLDLAMDALLEKHGMDNSFTLLMRHQVNRFLDVTAASNSRLERGKKPAFSNNDIFEMLSECYPHASRDLLLSLFRERVPGFKPE